MPEKYKTSHKTLAQIDLIRLGETDYHVEPIVFVHGWLSKPLWEKFISDEDDWMQDVGKDIKLGGCETFILEIWEDCDDWENWYDYRVMPDGFEFPVRKD